MKFILKLLLLVNAKIGHFEIGTNATLSILTVLYQLDLLEPEYIRNKTKQNG